MITKRFLLFAVFIAATIILIVPIANAENSPNVSSAIIASEVPLPPLHFNTSQEKIIVTGELSPGKNIRTTNGSLTTTTVPIGSIIHHSNNKTTVFDKNGQQVLVADDDQAETIHTFRGDQPATFIHEVPNNSVVVDDGNILHIAYNSTRVLTIIASNSNKSYIPESTQTCIGTPYPPGWIEGTEAPINSSSLYQFSADWNFPNSPYQTYANYPVFIWNGLSRCVAGDPHTGLVQPVLEWNYVSNTWTMSTWYVWTNQTIWPNNDAINSERVSGSISPGDTIRGNIWINTNGYDAIGSIIDLGPTGGGSSTLFLTQNTAPTRMSGQNLYAQIVLEGVSAIRQNNANYLPKPVTFKNFVLTDHDDNNLIPATAMTSFVNYPYWDHYNFTDSGNLTVYNRWPSDITLVNNPERVAPTVANFNALVTSGHGTTSVPFRDLSTGSPFLWLWNFGDGSSSTDQNPTHTYSIPGLFTVNLTVWNAGGVNSLVKPNYISIVFVPVPGFVVSADHGTAPLSVQFNDTSIYSPTNWNWSFGDGNYSTARNVTHTYSQTGTYNVSLYAANAAGGNTSAQKNINVIPVLKDRIGIFRNSTGYWYLDYNFDQAVEKSFILGTAGDISIVGDWNGDGFSDAGIFRPSTGYWYFDYNLDGIVDKSFRYGGSTDQIIKGDWDGEGKDGIAIFRPSTGYWYFDYNLDGIVDNTFRYGGNDDRIIAGKWNSTLQDGIAIFRNSTGYWYFDYNLDGVVDQSFRYGGGTDQIIKGDWDADGKDGIAIFRPSTGYWYFDYNLDGIVNSSFRFGGSTDQIIVGKWI